MDAHQAAIAAEWIGADITIPMHYNTFDMIRQDPHEFQRLAERRGIRVSVLQPGEEMEI